MLVPSPEYLVPSSAAVHFSVWKTLVPRWFEVGIQECFKRRFAEGVKHFHAKSLRKAAESRRVCERDVRYERWRGQGLRGCDGLFADCHWLRTGLGAGK